MPYRYATKDSLVGTGGCGSQQTVSALVFLCSQSLPTVCGIACEGIILLTLLKFLSLACCAYYWLARRTGGHPSACVVHRSPRRWRLLFCFKRLYPLNTMHYMIINVHAAFIIACICVDCVISVHACRGWSSSSVGRVLRGTLGCAFPSLFCSYTISFL